MSAFLYCRGPFWCLLAVALFLGCDDDQWKTVELDIVSLAATDSVAEGGSLEVQFGHFATGENQFSAHSWEMADSVTLRLRVFYRFRESDAVIGAPAYLTSDAVVLESPPARTFRILAGDTSLEIQGGAEPLPTDRLTVVLSEDGRPLVGAILQLLGASPGVESEIVPLPPTDSEGITRVVGACPVPSSRFWIESTDGRFRVRATARWPSSCETPLRLAVSGTDLRSPAEP